MVSPAGRFAANVGIRDGRIAVVSTGRLAAKRKIDAGGKLLLPGQIDPHGHMAHCWGDGEGFRHETRRKALGGVTTYLDYASTPQGPLESMDHWRSQIETHSYVDIGIQPIIKGKETLSEIKDLLRLHGISSFKFYFSGLERELYPTIFSINDGVLVRAFEIIAALGPPSRAVVHAENWENRMVPGKRALGAGTHGRGGLDGRAPSNLRGGGHCSSLLLRGEDRLSPLYRSHRRRGRESLPARGEGA